ncbi:MlaD family protein [Ramlibacter sp. XY19]|uniref:MlaD family protein n=1 Tax=Ramlibacter paludis TaxID=2908000 RepID=UPI0023DB7789|nr:MlaD family protein [Ramlibacter paludis]MCG2592266.1 MlaD family protein [Ramlibacter paludis]
MPTSAEARARVLFATFLLLLAGGGVAWWLFTARAHTTYELRSRDSVSGLIAGAPVEFHGVEVGKVAQVLLADPRTARVLIEVRKDAPVTSATVATVMGRGLAARGFTGYVYVSLEDGPGASGKPLVALSGQPYPQIALAPAQMVSIDTAVQQMNSNVQQVSTLLQSTFDASTVAAMKETMASLDRVTRTLAANSARLETILANAEKASVQVQPLLQASSATVRTVQAQLLPQVRAMLQGAEQAGARLEPLLASSQDAVWSLQFQVLPQAEQAMGRLDHLSATMDDAVTRFRSNPASLLRRAAVAPGPGEVAQ